MPENQPCRLLRAGVFTLVCANLSAHGHALGSGHGVPFLGLLLGSLVVLAISWLAAGRRHGLATLTAWMCWGQFALHVSFSYTQSLMSAHAHTADALTHTHHSAWTMLATHGAAALLSAWWLHRGERTLFAFLGFMARQVPTLLISTNVPALPRLPGAGFTVQRSRPLRPHLCWSRLVRGPPVVATA